MRLQFWGKQSRVHLHLNRQRRWISWVSFSMRTFLVRLVSWIKKSQSQHEMNNLPANHLLAEGSWRCNCFSKASGWCLGKATCMDVCGCWCFARDYLSLLPSRNQNDLSAWDFLFYMNLIEPVLILFLGRTDSIMYHILHMARSLQQETSTEWYCRCDCSKIFPSWGFEAALHQDQTQRSHSRWNAGNVGHTRGP